MRILSFFMALVFLGFGIVQFNDPDPWLWVPIYFYAAVCSIAFGLGIDLKWLNGIGAVAYLIGFIALLPRVEAFVLENELAREAMGLLICSIWLGVLGGRGTLSDRQTGLTQ